MLTILSGRLARPTRSALACTVASAPGWGQLEYGRLLPIGLTPNAPMDSVARWAGPIFPSP
jgi:hypothetical protein